MGLLFDIHLHTQRHSACSRIDARQLIPRAVAAGLDGLVLTEHHYQWPPEELAELLDTAQAPGFILLSGFEYSSCAGDILIYGLPPEAAEYWPPYEPPERILAQALEEGAFCIAAHPTREGLAFDERILSMPFDALEIGSTNLKPHEQRRAARLAESLGLPGTVASDAHRLQDVGAYAVEVDSVVHSIADIAKAIRQRSFKRMPAAGNNG